MKFLKFQNHILTGYRNRFIIFRNNSGKISFEGPVKVIEIMFLAQKVFSVEEEGRTTPHMRSPYEAL